MVVVGAAVVAVVGTGLGNVEGWADWEIAWGATGGSCFWGRDGGTGGIKKDFIHERIILSE